MPRFPITYDVDLERPPSSAMELHAGRRPVLAVGPPPEFGGTEAWWSPEHLLVSAAAACFTATLIAGAERARVGFEKVQLHAKGTLDKTAAGVAFTSIQLALELELSGAEDIVRAENLVDEAKKHCFVANSLRCPVDVSVRMAVAGRSAQNSHSHVA
jgi:organic hydroperoxide reductase OsmC/OhrA